MTIRVKLIFAGALAALTAAIPETRGYALWVFFIAVVVVFVAEGVRMVPQQGVHVVERLGRFQGVLNSGFNVVIPFVDRVAYVIDPGRPVSFEGWIDRSARLARVRCESAQWEARVEDSEALEPGATVYVLAADGSTLRVAKRHL